MSLMYAQMGLAVGGAFLQRSAEKAQATVAKAQQEYHNVVAGLQATAGRNTITANEVAVRDAALRAAEGIQLQSMKDRASASVSAAAAGVKGGSVTATLAGMARSRLQARQAIHTNLMSQAAQFADQRNSIAINSILNKDITQIRAPSIGSSLLGLGMSIIDIYDSHQPNDKKLLARVK